MPVQPNATLASGAPQPLALQVSKPRFVPRMYILLAQPTVVLQSENIETEMDKSMKASSEGVLIALTKRPRVLLLAAH